MKWRRILTWEVEPPLKLFRTYSRSEFQSLVSQGLVRNQQVWRIGERWVYVVIIMTVSDKMIASRQWGAAEVEHASEALEFNRTDTMYFPIESYETFRYIGIV